MVRVGLFCWLGVKQRMPSEQASREIEGDRRTLGQRATCESWAVLLLWLRAGLEGQSGQNGKEGRDWLGKKVFHSIEKENKLNSNTNLNSNQGKEMFQHECNKHQATNLIWKNK
jgi:hypothetical protein